MLRSQHIELSSYSTKKLQYTFYFPHVGTVSHWPCHVSSSDALLAFAQPTSLVCVRVPTSVPARNWQWVSQQAPVDVFLEYLSTENLSAVCTDAVFVSCWWFMCVYRMRV
jgi:hypothetical protein